MATKQTFAARLQDPRDPVGKAFTRLCNEGCDPSWLEQTLRKIADRKFPFGRELIVFTENHTKALDKAIAELQYAAGGLERLIAMDKKRYETYDDELRNVMPLFTTELPQSQLFAKAISFDDVPVILRNLSTFLQTLIDQDITPHKLQTMTATSFLPYFIQMIRRQTKKYRPHFSELAILLTAAYGRKTQFTTNYLRQIARFR